MNGKRLTIWIDGREALPVRAIPYVAGWRFSPDELLKRLQQNFNTNSALTAYRDEGDIPIPVKHYEWEPVASILRARMHDLSEKYGDDVDAFIAAWDSVAPSLLPAGIYIWRDEYESEFRRDCELVSVVGGTNEEDELIFAPMLDDATRTMVLEGFELQSGGSGSGVANAVTGTSAASTLPEGIPTGKIVEKFKLSEAWKSKLTHIKPHPFLNDALMRKGCRHEGNKRRMSHLWNPVRFAEILIEREGRNRRAMEAIITKHFADWQDVWHESMASDETDEYAA